MNSSRRRHVLGCCVRRAIGSWAMTCGLGASAFAQAQGAPSTPELVDVTACGPGTEVQEFVKLLRVEASGAEPAIDPAANPALSHCNLGVGRVVLAVGKVAVTLDVGDVPEPARFRTLAVAVVETLRNWPLETGRADETATPGTVDEPGVGDPAIATTPAPAVVADPAPVVPVTPSPNPRLDWGASVTLDGQVFGPELSTSWGGTFGLRRAWSNALAAVVVLGYQSATAESELGSARAHLIPLGAFVERRWGTVTELRLGVGGRWTYVLVDADSRWGLVEPRRKTYWGGLGLQTTLAVPAAPGWVVLVGGELLWALRGAKLTAGTEPGFSYYGLGAGLRVGVEAGW